MLRLVVAPGRQDGGRMRRSDPTAVASTATAPKAVADEATSAQAPQPVASPAPDGQERRGAPSTQDARDRLDAAAVMSFTKDLAGMAAADPIDGDAVLGRLEPEPAGPGVARQAARDAPRPARRETVEHGGDDPEPAGSPGGGDVPPPSPDAGSSPPLLVRPAARLASLRIDEALAAGAEAEILVGYQAELVTRLVPRMTSPNWAALLAALGEARTPIAAAFVLKALAAHRHPPILHSFAAMVNDVGDQEALRLQWRRGPVPPLDAGAEPRDLRLHYDPVEALFPRGRGVRESAPVQPWPLPRWLRGIYRAPLELAIVAVDQALGEDLRPDERTGDGAGDALTFALAPHGDTHPSLARWLLNLCARADSRSGLVHMREVMMRARLEMAR